MSTVKKFRKKPVVIEALQFDGTNAQQCAEFTGEPQDGWTYGTNCDFYEIETLEGDMKARPGWWIIKGVQGEFYPCDPDIFAKTYDAAESAA